jgi:hypothetical protein
MGIARVGVVDDVLAPLLEGVELLHVPIAVVAELRVDAGDHLAPHIGGPGALAPADEGVEREHSFA